MNHFGRHVDFNALSVNDLAEARDVYHVHLANLDNVVGTALGRYLIRREDPNFKDPRATSSSWTSEPRTLANSGVTSWSWPCVLVFVSKWMVDPPDRTHADQVVPRRLYMSDGRQVPTCVVHTPLTASRTQFGQTRFASTINGAGFPLFTEHQDRRRMGTVSALVTDGASVYALTSRHVVGSEQSVVSMASHGEMRRIGSTARAVELRPLDALYPGLSGTRAEVSLDGALVELDSIDDWTTQLYGLGLPGELIDINVDTVALGLIGCPVKTFAAGSGQMRGSILGLFHRWRSVGGTDQMTELLIGPRPDDTAIGSVHGDSGALWVWDEDAEPNSEGGTTTMFLTAERELPVVRPVAMQWGGQVVLDPAGGRPGDYVLASTIASLASTLNFTLLHDDSLSDQSLYWGKVGHYTVAMEACRLGKKDSKLATLLTANANRISVTANDINTGHLPSAAPHGDFVALADVPDLVWRSLRQKDAPSHFADMDEPGGAAVDGKTLMELWETGGKWRTPAGWTEYYDSLPQPPELKHRGALPFRVAQLYTAMVDAVTANDMLRFIGAAGVLAHYVGDACQPLHVSRLHHGLPESPHDDDVHSIYETKMLDRYAPEIVTGVQDAIGTYRAGGRAGPRTFNGADKASGRVIDLMARTIAAIAPQDIVDVFNEHTGPSRVPSLWEAFGPGTIDRLADGTRTLAVIWQSAWDEGHGSTTPVELLAAQDRTALKTLYEDKDWVPNAWLRDMP